MPGLLSINSIGILNAHTLLTGKSFLKIFCGFFLLIRSYNTVQYRAGSDCVGGVSNCDHIDFRVTSRLLVVAVALNADPKVYPTSWKGVSSSNHPIALASQVAWITGESQISRPKAKSPGNSNVRGLAHRKYWNPARQSFHTGGVLVAAVEGLYYIGPLSADQHKQIGIRRAATAHIPNVSAQFNVRTFFIKQKENFEKSQDLKGRSENFENP
jgi:hypothetical protein